MAGSNNGSTLTPTQQRMMAVLGDGLAHPLRQLHGCCNDDLTEPGTVHTHVCLLRPKVAKRGQSIICFSDDGVTFYQLRQRTGRT
jgi:hypothetical protein